MSLENPVANVDDVNVLLHNDVAGKNAVIQPVAKATLCGGGVRPGGPVNVAGEIVSFAADDFAKRSGMNATNHFHKRRAIADLESDIETELAFGALADFDHLQRTGHIDGHGLFEINMFTAGDDNLQVAGMIVRRCGDDDGVQLLGRSNLLAGAGADEKLRGIQSGIAFGLLELIEMRAGRVELILK
jgi:hypothetical protein